MTSISHISSNPSDFYVLGGTLPRDARSYAARVADEDLLEGLRKGQFCYVLTSRQMGKSSLMVRTVTRLRQENVTCLVIDLTATGQNLSEDQWYDGLLNCVATDLNLEDELDDFWQSNKRLGPLQRWMHALRSVVLTHVTGSVVIFIDEVDAVRSLPFSADEFFAGVRECYNRRTEDPEFKRLTFCLLGVATPADLIRDTRSTPFNIGQRIALTDFTEAEAAPLAEGLAARRDGGTGRRGDGETPACGDREKMLLSRVLYWTHGHPYLTQRLCSAISEARVDSPSGVDKVCNDIFLSSGAQAIDDNLLFVRERLLRTDCDPTNLLMLYDKVRSGKRVPTSETDYQIGVLRLSGVVRVENGVLCVRNRIYAHVFDRAWVRRSIPDEDVKRQKIAFRKGVFGTALAGAALMLLLTSGFMLTHYQKHLNMRVPLSDGSQLIVDDVTFGEEAIYEPGMFRWSALLVRPFTKIFFPRPTLSLWLRRYDPKTGKTNAFSDYTAIAAVDEHGHQFVATDSAIDSGNDSRIDFENFPRRDKTIRVQIFGLPVGNSRLAILKKEFVVPNPTATLYPLWSPEPLPSTKTVGDLAVRLESVNWSQPSRDVNNGVPYDSYTINPKYNCRERGQQLAYPWQMVGAELLDATGNRSSTPSTSGCLCIYEPAWMVRMRLARPDAAAFPPADTWTLKDIAVPQNGSVGLLSGVGTVDGVTLNSVSLGVAPYVTYTLSAPPKASGTLPKKWDYAGKYSGGASSMGTNGMIKAEINGTQPQVAVHVTGLTENQKLTIWATDSTGRRYNQILDSGTLSLGKLSAGNTNVTSLQVRPLPIPSTIHRVNLHFAIQDIKTVEFMVRPPLPGTGSQSK